MQLNRLLSFGSEFNRYIFPIKAFSFIYNVMEESNSSQHTKQYAHTHTRTHIYVHIWQIWYFIYKYKCAYIYIYIYIYWTSLNLSPSQQLFPTEGWHMRVRILKSYPYISQNNSTQRSCARSAAPAVFVFLKIIYFYARSMNVGTYACSFMLSNNVTD